MRLPSLSSRFAQITFWSCLAVAAALGAFVLPFGFPLREPVYSAAYTVGENNRVAAIAIALLAVVTLLAARWLPKNVSAAPADVPVDYKARLSRSYLWWGMGVTAVCTALFAHLIVHRGTYYADAGYFVVQLRSAVFFHRPVYSSFEFPYGPLLYGWPVAFIRLLHPLGLGLDAAYMVSVVAMCTLGVGLLFYCVQAMPMSRRLKAVAFCLMTVCAFDTLLGLNYAVVRGILPFAGVVFLSRQVTTGRAVLVALLGGMLQMGVSPEIGIAFCGAAIVYGGYRAVYSGYRWLAPGVAAVLGAVCLVAVTNPQFLLTFAQIAKGGYNIVLEPLPFVLMLLFAVVVLAPLAVAPWFWQRDRTQSATSGRMAACFAATLALLPAALSRGDALHCFFNGMGAYLLSFAAVQRFGPKWQRVWIVCVALCFAGTQVQQLHGFRPALEDALRGGPIERHGDVSLVPGIVRAVGSGRVSMPWSNDLHLITALTAAGVYEPGYYDGLFGCFDRSAEERKVRDMRSVEYALVPADYSLTDADKVYNDGAHRLLRFGLRYKLRRAPFQRGELLVQELRANWVAAGHFGVYTLYRKVR